MSDLCRRFLGRLLASVVLLGAAGAGATSSNPPSDHVADQGQGVHIVWENVQLDIPAQSAKGNGSRREHVLAGVSGEALPGRLLAIMGPSGCGKTSLLNVLTGRVSALPGTRLTGEVWVAGRPLGTDPEAGHSVAYVRHRHHFYPFLTVRETLLLAARLRGVPDADAAVERLAGRLGLAGAVDTPVGDDHTPGISDGERRRLGIGLELVGIYSSDSETGTGNKNGEAWARPTAILLDEPTSGLDSYNALLVMRLLRGLCAEGHTVVASIHQPRSAIYALFDDVLLLGQGRVADHGPAAGALARLAAAGFAAPPAYNPADFMVDLVSGDEGDGNGNGNGNDRKGNGGNREDGAGPLDRLVAVSRERWQQRRYVAERAARAASGGGGGCVSWDGDSTVIAEGGEPESGCVAARAEFVCDDVDEGSSGSASDSHSGYGRDGGGCDAGHNASGRYGFGTAGSALPSLLPSQQPPGRALTAPPLRRRPCGFFQQFALLFGRSWRQATRNRGAARARGLAAGILGAIFGGVFWQLGPGVAAIDGRVSLLFNVVVNTAMIGCIRALQTFSIERPVIALERMEQGYSMLAYFVSKVLAEAPTDLTFGLLFGPVVYVMAGLHGTPWLPPQSQRSSQSGGGGIGNGGGSDGSGGAGGRIVGGWAPGAWGRSSADGSGRAGGIGGCIGGDWGAALLRWVGTFQAPGPQLGRFLGVLSLASMSSSALGLMIGCLSPSQDVANILGPAVNVVFLLVGGANREMPGPLKRLEAASTIKWGVQALAINEFDGLDFDPRPSSSGGSGSVAGRGGSHGGGGEQRWPPWWPGRPPKVSGRKVLDSLGYSDTTLPQAAFRLATLAAAFHTVTMMTLAVSTPKFQKLEPPPGRPTLPPRGQPDPHEEASPEPEPALEAGGASTLREDETTVLRADAGNGPAAAVTAAGVAGDGRSAIGGPGQAVTATAAAGGVGGSAGTTIAPGRAMGWWRSAHLPPFRVR